MQELCQKCNRVALDGTERCMAGVEKVCTNCDILLCHQAEARYEQRKTIQFMKKVLRDEFLMENFNPTKSGIYPTYIRIDQEVDPLKYVEKLNQKVTQKFNEKLTTWFIPINFQFVLNSEKQVMYSIDFPKYWLY